MKGKYDMRKNDLMIIENCLESKEDKLDAGDEPFEKLMFFYESALNQLETQMNIIKREFKTCISGISFTKFFIKNISSFILHTILSPAISLIFSIKFIYDFSYPFLSIF